MGNISKFKYPRKKATSSCKSGGRGKGVSDTNLVHEVSTASTQSKDAVVARVIRNRSNAVRAAATPSKDVIEERGIRHTLSALRTAPTPSKDVPVERCIRHT